MPSSDDFADLLALVQPPAASASTEGTTSQAAAEQAPPPAALDGIDLSSLTPADRALLQPLIDALSLDDAPPSASEDLEDTGLGVDDALREEMEKLERAEAAAGDLESSLDRLLARLEGMEEEVESDGDGEADAEASSGEKTAA